MPVDRVIWEVTYIDDSFADPLLADGWEPFAVVPETRDYGLKVYVLCLRRQRLKETTDAP